MKHKNLFKSVQFLHNSQKDFNYLFMKKYAYCLLFLLSVKLGLLPSKQARAFLLPVPNLENRPASPEWSRQKILMKAEKGWESQYISNTGRKEASWTLLLLESRHFPGFPTQLSFFLFFIFPVLTDPPVRIAEYSLNLILMFISMAPSSKVLTFYSQFFIWLIKVCLFFSRFHLQLSNDCSTA